MSFTGAPWPLRSLNDVCAPKQLVDPQRKPNEPFRYIDISSVSNTTFTVMQSTSILGSEAPSRARKLVQSGDIIFATTRPYLRNVARIDDKDSGSICSTGFCILRPKDSIDSKWLFYLALSDELVASVTQKMRGANYPAVSDGDVLAVKVPVPPLPEQRRIVARIDEIMQRVEEVRALRSANLAMGCGLLPSLLKEEFAGIDGVWPSVTIGSITVESRYGTSQKCRPDNLGTPVLRIPNVADRCCNFENLKYLPHSVPPDDLLALAAGDILVVRTNGSPDLVGRCAVVPELDRVFGYASYLIRLRLDPTRARPAFVAYFLSSTFGRDQIAKLRRTSAGQFNINGKAIASIKLPLPPLNIQDELVGRMDRIDAVSRDARVRIEAQVERDNLLPAAILRKAFAGEL